MSFVIDPFQFGGPPVATYQTAVVLTNDAASYSHLTVPIGVASEDRRIVVSVQGTAVGAIDVSSVTIKVSGQPDVVCTVGRAGGISNLPVEIWISGFVPAGTTATIDIVFTTTSNYSAIQVWSTTGIVSTTPTDTDTDSAGALLIDVAPQGIVFCAGAILNNASVTWTNATERNDALAEAFQNYTAADYTGGDNPETNRSITCSSVDSEIVTAVAWR